MNSTQWSTLTEFIKHLGRSGKCIVDETPKGWFIQYIDRDPDVLARQKELDKRNKAEKDDETRYADWGNGSARRTHGVFALPPPPLFTCFCHVHHSLLLIGIFGGSLSLFTTTRTLFTRFVYFLRPLQAHANSLLLCSFTRFALASHTHCTALCCGLLAHSGSLRLLRK
jgi:hypothetical protein